MTTRWSRVAAALVATTLALPHSTLSVRDGSAWRVWWDARNAPVHWQPADTARLGRIDWRSGAAGIEWTEVVLAGSGEAWRTRVIAARIDPRRVQLSLDTSFARDGRPQWTIARAHGASIFAVNAGQFLHSMPWGQVVLDGTQWLSPGTGLLASTVSIDANGNLRLLHGAAAAPARGTWAFQSYPTLLRGGEIPTELRGASDAIDLEHRDARAAIGVAIDGRVIVAITRFDALGATLGFIPFGLTTPEMAAVMGALGSRDAVMLDGGISGQMMVRGADGALSSWRGTRAVPLALIGLAR